MAVAVAVAGGTLAGACVVDAILTGEREVGSDDVDGAVCAGGECAPEEGQEGARGRHGGQGGERGRKRMDADMGPSAGAARLGSLIAF